ncbi:MAG: hypothetical protein HYV52_02875 [Parcubacteria group bacterium]|nr:hypothetical protein [Parcubacteria group bacterium]
MPLEEIEKKLYQQAESEAEKIPQRQAAPFGVEPVQNETPPVFEPFKLAEEFMPQTKKRRWILWLVLFLLVIFGGVISYWSFFIPRFAASEVLLEIKAPTSRVQAGEKITFSVNYKNQSRIVLQDVELTFIFPKSSQLILGPGEKVMADRITKRIGVLNSGEEGSSRFETRIFGLNGETKSAEVILSYQPEKIASFFENKARFNLSVAEVPLEISLVLPSKVTLGQDFDFSIHYLSRAKTVFSNLKIKLDSPPSFKYLEFSSKPLEDSVWLIGDLEPGKEGDIKIKGRIEGEVLTLGFKAAFGSEDPETKNFEIFSEASESLNLISSPLRVSQKINGLSEYDAKAGDNLQFDIEFENTTAVGIPDAIIMAQIEGKALDLTSLNISNGSFNQTTNSIIWNPGLMPELSYLDPGERGVVSYGVKVKNPLPISAFGDTNFKIISRVKIDSSKAPLELANVKISGESEASIKISGKLSLKASGLYRSGPIKNTGPIPPKIANQTSYTIVWRITNTANDDSNVEVRAILPPHIAWLNRFEPSSANLNYNSLSGEVVWKVGDVKAATGILRPALEVAFQIGLTPSLSQIGRAVDLISASHIKGQDNFTGISVEESKAAIFTDLPDDRTFKQGDGIVVQ